MAFFEKAKLTDSVGNLINPATEESIILLRRMVKLLESQSATDIGNRQRVTIDSITTALPTGTNNIGFTNGQDQRQFIDAARTNYSNAIRSRLTFS